MESIIFLDFKVSVLKSHLTTYVHINGTCGINSCTSHHHIQNTANALLFSAQALRISRQCSYKDMFIKDFGKHVEHVLRELLALLNVIEIPALYMNFNETSTFTSSVTHEAYRINE